MRWIQWWKRYHQKRVNHHTCRYTRLQKREDRSFA